MCFPLQKRRQHQLSNPVSHRQLTSTFGKARLIEATFHSSANCMAVSHSLCFIPHILTPATDLDSVPLQHTRFSQLQILQISYLLILDRQIGLDWLQTRNNSDRTLYFLNNPPTAHQSFETVKLQSGQQVNQDLVF